LLLVVVAVFPMLSIQGWHEHDLRNEREGVIRQQVVHGVKQLAAEIGELREGARLMLLAIAQLEAVKLRQPEPCRMLLAKLKSEYPNYSQLAAAETNGRIFCASGPTVASVADQPFFTRAMAHDGLTVGNYWVDPTAGQKMIHFAVQFDDGNGHLAGIVFAGLDLAWLSDHLKERGLSPTWSKLIADREGNIIARLPHPEEFVGRNIRKSHDRIMDGGEAGWEEVTGVDGIRRIFGYLASGDFFLSVRESQDEAFAAIDGATRRSSLQVSGRQSMWPGLGGGLLAGPPRGCAGPLLTNGDRPAIAVYGLRNSSCRSQFLEHCEVALDHLLDVADQLVLWNERRGLSVGTPSLDRSS
jgi:hypothetical protein